MVVDQLDILLHHASMSYPNQVEFQQAFILGAKNPNDVPVDWMIRPYHVAAFFKGQKFYTNEVQNGNNDEN